MSLPKPHFKQTFVREENGERTITRSAVVDTPAGPLRVWMEETWALAQMAGQEKRLLEERTCYWSKAVPGRFRTLEMCITEATAPQPAEA